MERAKGLIRSLDLIGVASSPWHLSFFTFIDLLLILCHVFIIFSPLVVVLLILFVQLGIVTILPFIVQLIHNLFMISLIKRVLVCLIIFGFEVRHSSVPHSSIEPIDLRASSSSCMFVHGLLIHVFQLFLLSLKI